MTAEAMRRWGRETVTTTGLIWKAFFRWVGLIIVSATGIGFFIILLSGDPRKTLQAFYSVLIVVPVLILFHVNAVVYFVLTVLGIQLDYDRSFYGVVKWIERKKLYDPKDTKQ